MSPSMAKPQGRVAKAVLDQRGAADDGEDRQAIPTATPVEVFDGFRSALAANRAQFFLDVPAGPFYGYQS
jgi:non-heme chloroperoxidase